MAGDRPDFEHALDALEAPLRFASRNAFEHLNRVKDLLRETDLSLIEIARRAGYEHVEYLSVVFKKKIGSPPSEYRKRHRR